MSDTQRRIAQAATLIAGLTLLARLVGFLRTLVFARTVGPTCLGSTYQTANSVPNILYEVVAGGALATLVIPLIAGHISKREDEQVRRIASALLTWAILILVPLSILVVVFSTQIMQFLLGDTPCDGALESGARMLRVFAPQLVLYGISIVYAGVLQAYGRFAGPAMAPLLSSLFVIGAYLLFAAVTPDDVDLDTVTLNQELILSVGTTIGVLVLTLSNIVPSFWTPFRYRPRLSMPAGLVVLARDLALWGAVALTAQQLSVVATLRLGNDGAPEGTVVIYNLAYAVFLLPWAVLAVPIATSAFPTLSAQWDRGDRAAFRITSASALRTVFVLAFLAAAMMAAAAWPTAAVVIEGANGPPATDVLARTLTLLAPGLIGLSLMALLQRTLNAAHRPRAAALAISAGYAVMIVLAVILSRALPASVRAETLAAATSVGVLIGAALLLVALRRLVGRDSLAGIPRTVVVAAGAALLSTWIGRMVSDAMGQNPPLQSIVQALITAAVVVIVFAAVTIVFDRSALRSAVQQVRPGSGGTPDEASDVDPGTTADGDAEQGDEPTVSDGREGDAPDGPADREGAER